MKKYLLFLLLITSLLGCNKDEELDLSENSDEETTYRIKQSIMSTGDGYEYRKTNFNYDSNLLSEIIIMEPEVDTIWNTIKRQKITYGDDQLIVKAYYYEAEEWLLYDEMDLYFDNDLLIKEVHYELGPDSLLKNAKFSYEYSSDGLSEWKKYYLSPGVESEYLHGLISYENGIITEHTVLMNEDDEWINYKKEIPSYDNNQLSQWIYNSYYSNEWHNSSKMDFYYLNDLVDRSVIYYWTEEDWDSIVGYSYTYDQNDLLTEIILPDGSKTSYTYESGEGNTNIILYDPMQEFNGSPKLKQAKNESFIRPYYKKYLGIE